MFAKRGFEKRVVLGWYAGEVVPAGTGMEGGNAYLLEVPVGFVSAPLDDEDEDDDRGDSGYASSPSGTTETGKAEPEPTILIDARRMGNWTRFINHSCKPHCEFRMRRVGKVRIMVVEVVRRIREGAEVTVDYGPEYYGRRTGKWCECGEGRCVSRVGKRGKGEDGEGDGPWCGKGVNER